MTPEEYEKYLDGISLRCPRCGWALYDGQFSMNRDCDCDEGAPMTRRAAHTLAEQFKTNLAAK